jgi:hypothetical protein
MRPRKRKEKARQASKLAKIHKALVSAGCDTVRKQAAVLGLRRSTTYAILNLDKRAGPSANIIKRILSSPNLPPRVRRKFEEYIQDKIFGRYGHSQRSAQAFRDVFSHEPSDKQLRRLGRSGSWLHEVERRNPSL